MFLTIRESHVFFQSLQMIAQEPENAFMFLKAFFSQDMSEIENDERFIGIFFKEPELTGNDVPDNLEINRFQSSINDDTPLGRFARTRKKIKAKKYLYALNQILKEQAKVSE